MVPSDQRENFRSGMCTGIHKLIALTIVLLAWYVFTGSGMDAEEWLTGQVSWLPEGWKHWHVATGLIVILMLF